jgi:hypothetical protein
MKPSKIQNHQWKRQTLARSRGTATIEFALVVPIVLVLVLLLLQFTLLMVGNIFVHYAAYAATRTAITQIPQDYDNGVEPSNVFLAGSSSVKYRLIQRAAAAALVTVSGRLESGQQDADAFAAAVGGYFDAAGVSRPRWVETLAADRWRYAHANTDITVLIADAPEGGAVTFAPVLGVHQFGPIDPVTVRVEHKFFLSVPYVSGFFADGQVDEGQGSGRYAMIQAQYTLPNLGLSKNLPPRPSLRRDP